MAFDVDMKLNENDFFFFTKLWGVHNNLMWHVIIGYWRRVRFFVTQFCRVGSDLGTNLTRTNLWTIEDLGKN